MALRRIPWIVSSVIALSVVTMASASAATLMQTQTQNFPPFASGVLQSRSGSTLDLQSANGYRKVIITSSTKYSQTTVADSSAITVGGCVRIGGTGSASKGIAASIVSVNPSTKNCDAGLRAQARGNGTRRFGDGSFRGAEGGNGPGSRVPGANRSVPSNFAMINGKVVRVAGDTVAVKGNLIARSTSSKGRPKPTTKTVTATLGSTTRITHTVGATADALTVGSCVNAAGNTDSVGTVTAKTVTVSPADNGTCGGPFGFGQFGGDNQARRSI